MANAWGTSFGVAWGASWGVHVPQNIGGSVAGGGGLAIPIWRGYDPLSKRERDALWPHPKKKKKHEPGPVVWESSPPLPVLLAFLDWMDDDE